MDAFVIIPRVPSDPMNKCFMSYPVLSLRMVDKQSIIVPSPKTYILLITLMSY